MYEYDGGINGQSIKITKSNHGRKGKREKKQKVTLDCEIVHVIRGLRNPKSILFNTSNDISFLFDFFPRLIIRLFDRKQNPYMHIQTFKLIVTVTAIKKKI